MPPKQRRRQRATALVGVAALTGSLLVACTADDAETTPPAPSRVSLNVPVKAEPNGEPVILESSVFVPSGSGRFPALILGHGFGGSMDQTADRARDLAARGYVVLTYSARGFGRSGGRIHLNSPDYEIADITALVDALSKRPDVLTDGAEDPRVGLVGTSYAGAAGLMAAGADPRIDAVVATATWNDLGSVFYADATVPPDKVVKPGKPLPTAGAATQSSGATPGAATASEESASPGGSGSANPSPATTAGSPASPAGAASAPAETPGAESPGRAATPAEPAPADEVGVFKRRWASIFFSSAVQSAAAASRSRDPGAATSSASPTTAPAESASPAASDAPTAGTPASTPASPAPDATAAPLPESRSAAPASGPVQCGRFDVTLCERFLSAAATGDPAPELITELRRNSPAPTMAKVKAPTLLIQGMQDSLFGLDQADATAQALLAAQVPVAVRWYEGGHDGGSEPGDAEAVLPWLDRYLTDPGRQSGFGLPVPAFTAPVPATQRGTQPSVISVNAYPGISPFGRLIRSGDTSAATSPVPSAPASSSATSGTAPLPSGSASASTSAPSVATQPPAGAQASSAATAARPTGTSAAQSSAPPSPSAGNGAPASSPPVTPGVSASEAPDPWTGTSLVDLHGVDAGGARLLSPPGGDPAAVTSIPGLDQIAASDGGSSGGAAPAAGAAGGLGSAAYALAALPGQSAAFDTDVLTDRRTVAGSPQVTLTLTATSKDAVFFVSLWRLSPSGPVLPRRLVAPVHITTTPGTPTQVTVALPAGTYSMEEGSRWRVLVSATDSTYAAPTDARFYTVSVADDAKLVLPTGRADAPDSDDTDHEVAGLLIALGVLALLILAGAAYLWRRRRTADRRAVRDDLRDTPLVVQGLTKSYREGELAVDEAAWSASRGQVVGLLGPNGSGKTTTMRMLTGLIRPDSGDIHVLGEPVHAGSPVLRHVGALIDDPGFLPHLTGRQNLQAFWRATGRGSEEAHIESALAVAGLGEAVERPVRTYSHGMRQRLGIAQAMLGRPELLLLDEPTNGLDPSQIATMRTVLRDYAATGSAVVISSHLLSEVEQSCSHVVVMDRGRVVTSGAVADLVAGPDTTVVTLAEGADVPAVAERVRVALADGVRDVEVDQQRRTLTVSADVPRPLVVAEVVAAGGQVVAVADRRRLEEVFLGVVGRHAPEPEQGATR